MINAISFFIFAVVVLLCYKGWKNRSWYYPVIYANRRKRRALQQGKAKLTVKAKK